VLFPPIKWPNQLGAKKVPTWEGKVLERKQKQFWNQWSSGKNMAACQNLNSKLHQNKNHPNKLVTVCVILAKGFSTVVKYFVPLSRIYRVSAAPHYYHYKWNIYIYLSCRSMANIFSVWIFVTWIVWFSILLSFFLLDVWCPVSVIDVNNQSFT